MRLRLHLVPLLFCLFTMPVLAKPFDAAQLPDALASWKAWVLDGEHVACPSLASKYTEKYCAWAGVLQLSLEKTQGRFTQQWQVFESSEIQLPGDARQWPQDVLVNGKPYTVIEQKDRPVLALEPGTYTIHGNFSWDSLPESVQLGDGTGLLGLTVDGKAIEFPVRERGRVWVQKKQARENITNVFHLQVYRKLTDQIPFEVTTHFSIEVAGRQREERIPQALLPGFIAKEVRSALPARLESDGTLRIQVRPGTWEIELTARYPQNLTHLGLPSLPAPWPDSEIWAFEAQNQLRLVEIQNLTTIDPRQTNLPGKWQSLPAYRVKAGDEMQIKVIRRGDPEPAPDQLRLERQMWLAFDGSKYAVQDSIQGTMTKGWRLEVQPNLALGRVTLDGQPQLITTLGNGPGVEVRRGSIALDAEATIEGDIDQIPASGWKQDFRQVTTTLHLPPGWKVFSLRGVDNVPDSWINHWTLLDLFLVLLIAIATARLFTWYWGLFALLTMSLLWHETLAPTYIWLNLLAAIALLRVLPDNKFKRIVFWYRNLCGIALIVIAVPYSIDAVRLALYPQLEYPYRQVVQEDNVTQRPATTLPAAAPQVSAKREADSISSRRMEPKRYLGNKLQSYDSFGSGISSSVQQNILLDEIDPNAQVQTGPGLPAWRWNQIQLRWSGPVLASQQVRLIYLSPAINRFLNVLRVLLIIGFAALLFDVIHRGKNLWKYGSQAALLLLAVPLLGTPDPAMAQMPTPELLQEMKQKLLRADECFPSCANVSRMQLETSPDQLQIRMEVHAQADVAIPIPGTEKTWLPTEVLLNGVPAVVRPVPADPNGALLVLVKKGLHILQLRGPLPARSTVSLPLGLTPKQVRALGTGWKVEGIHENGVADSQLQLTRLRVAGSEEIEKALEPSALPGFLEVERTLRLGLDWTVETRVVRRSPTGTTILAEIPLLPGESVTTENIRVKDGHALVNLGPNQSAVFWRSTLKTGAAGQALVLKAPDTTQWTEVWRLDVSPIFHVTTQGIAAIHHTDAGGHWLPQWRPWPGEEVSLTITRPTPVEGRTITIDRSQVEYHPAQRSLEAVLQFRLLSSLGSQHTIRLPAAAALQSVQIDGKAQPIRQEKGAITLPVHPGEQNVKITWRETQDLPLHYRTSSVNLGTDSVNHKIQVNLGQDRWVLFVSGPRLGPAVLFWGVLIVLALLAYGLGKVKTIPLKGWQWFLLAVGFSQAELMTALVVVAWLFLLAWRQTLPKTTEDGPFNLVQIVIGVVTLFALTALFHAVSQGLLGYPDMQVEGNMSDAYHLNWFSDYAPATLPTASILSVPLYIYRALMLLWSLWLAFTLLGLLRWAWQAFSANGIWRKISLHKGGNKPKDAQSAPAKEE